MYCIYMNWKLAGKPHDRGESPVQVSIYMVSSILSMAGHEESCLKLPGPSGKAKYY
jgi:hypothetical protein